MQDLCAKANRGLNEDLILNTGSVILGIAHQREGGHLLNSRALELDEQMIQAFEDREDALKAQMMRDKTWGTGEGMQSFPRERLMLWSDVAAEFLPTTDPDPED